MKRGKKAKQWTKDRANLIKEATLEGRITIQNGYPEGICEDCGKWRPLDPDHRRKRSLGGSNDKSNIDWVCRSCHNKRDNLGDPMQKKEVKSKKADWQKEHKCKNCKVITSMYLCHNCGKASI